MIGCAIVGASLFFFMFHYGSQQNDFLAPFFLYIVCTVCAVWERLWVRHTNPYTLKNLSHRWECEEREWWILNGRGLFFVTHSRQWYYLLHVFPSMHGDDDDVVHSVTNKTKMDRWELVLCSNLGVIHTVSLCMRPFGVWVNLHLIIIKIFVVNTPRIVHSQLAGLRSDARM